MLTQRIHLSSKIDLVQQYKVFLQDLNQPCLLEFYDLLHHISPVIRISPKVWWSFWITPQKENFNASTWILSVSSYCPQDYKNSPNTSEWCVFYILTTKTLCVGLRLIYRIESFYCQKIYHYSFSEKAFVYHRHKNFLIQDLL